MMETLEQNPAASGLSFLLEMEVVQSEAVLNALVANVMAMTKGITDVQFVIDSNAKKLLIYLEVTRWTRWFHLKKTEADALEILDQALPSFRKRVVFQKEILNKAIELVKGTKSTS